MTTVYSSFASASHRPSMEPFNRRLYVANGWDDMIVWSGIQGTTATTAGIAGPSTEPTDWVPVPTEPGSGSITAGTHKVRYRYKNSETGYVSNPSGAAEWTASGSANASFPISTTGTANMIRSTDSKVDTIVLEMAAIGQGIFYVAGETLQTASALVIDISDTALQESTPEWPETGHNVPPKFQELISFKERLWGFGQVDHGDGSVSMTNGSATATGSGSNWTNAVEGRFLQINGESEIYEIDTYASATSLTLKENYAGSTGAGKSYTIFSRDNSIYYSHANYPEAWPSFASFEGLGEERVRAVVGFGEGMVIFGLKNMEYFVYSTSPAVDGSKTPISGEGRGALNQRVVVVVEAKIYSMDRTGWFVFEGTVPRHISSAIDIRARNDLDYTFSDEFHAVFNPRTRSIRWYVVPSGQTEANAYYEFDIDREIWSEGSLDVATTTSSLVPRDQGLAVVVGDGNGHAWWDDEGTTMGGSSSVATVTLGAGSSTTVLQVSSPTLPTSGIGLQGVTLWDTVQDEVRVISANTENTITLASALSSAPPSGQEVKLGRVLSKLRSRWVTATAGNQPRFTTRTKGTYLWLFYRPLAASREVLVRFYRNWSSSAHSEWPARSYSSGKLLEEGVTIPANGSTDFVLNPSASTDGVARFPLGGDGLRVFSFEIEIKDPDTPFELFGFEIEGLAHQTDT